MNYIVNNIESPYSVFVSWVMM